MSRFVVCLTAGVLLFAGGCGGSNLGFSGAQDIGQFRAIVEAGGIPGPSTLDANGFFSEHLVELPEPDCGQDVCLHGMLAVQRDWLYDRGQMALQVAFNTPLEPDDLDPRPRDIVTVIDVSRSMLDDDRLVHVAAGLHLLIDAMSPEDRLGIVAYENEVRIVAELTEVNDASALHAAVDALEADGSTNLHDGLQTGLQMALAVAGPERQSQVILLSDGAPTRGVTDEGAIVFMASEYTMQGMRLSTVGVGVDASMDLLKRLAEQGGGTFYFVEDAGAVEEVFTEELDTILAPVAYDLMLEIVPGPGYRLEEVVGTTGVLVGEDAGMIHIPALFLASRDGGREGRRGGGGNLFFRMEAEDGTAPGGSHDVARLQFTYRTDPDPAAARFQQTHTVTSPYTPGQAPDEAWLSHEAMAKNAAMIGLFLGLRDVTTLRPACAAWAVQRLEDRTRTWLGLYDDADIASDLVLLEQLRGNLLGVLDDMKREVFEPEPPVLPGFCPPLYGDVCAAVIPRDGSGAGGMRSFVFLLLLCAARLGWARRRRVAMVALPALGLVVLLAGCEPLQKSVEVAGLPAAIALSAGPSHGCVLDDGGKMWCWGARYVERAGSTPAQQYLLPAEVDALDGIVQISATGLRDCARTDDDAVWCWGAQPVGDDTRRIRTVPTRVVDLDAATDVSAGREGGCAVDPQGEVWCWGVVPEQMDDVTDAVAVSAGQGAHGCAVTGGGEAWCWGNNYYGQLGNNTRGEPGESLGPVQVAGVGNARSVVACARHSCALTDNGRVLCWGDNGSGQGGYGPQELSTVARAVEPLQDVVDIACGDLHTCALTAGGRVFCWGDNLAGQLGDGTNDDHRRPVQVHDVEDAVALAAASSHACALLADGTVRCWGYDPYTMTLIAQEQ